MKTLVLFSLCLRVTLEMPLVYSNVENNFVANYNQPITVQTSPDNANYSSSKSEKTDADLLETEQLLKETFENHDGIVHPKAEGAGPVNENQPITVQESADDNGSSESEKSDADLLETEQLLKETFENHDGIVHPTAEGAGPVNENQPITVQESADDNGSSESEKSDADLLETEQLLKETFENHDGIVHPTAEGVGPVNENQPITVQDSADGDRSSESEKSDADLLETEQLLKETFENHDGIAHPTAEGAGPVNENQPITVQDSADGDRSSESEKSDADLLETEQLLKETFENHDGIVHPTAEGAGPVNENQPITVQESADGDRPSESEKSDADLLETEQLLKETFENHDGIVHPPAEGAGPTNEDQPITVQESADGDRSSESEKSDADLLETEQLLKETFENHDGIVHPTAEGAGPVNENQPITVQDSADGDRSSESEKSDADLLETEQLLKETFENHDGIVHPTAEGAGPTNEDQPITVQESADDNGSSESEKSDADLLETEQLLKETFENHDGIVHPTAEGAGPVNENQPITVQDSADGDRSSESEKSDADLLETEQLLKETFENHDGIVHPTAEGAGPVNENQPITVQDSADGDRSSESEKSDADLLETEQLLKETFENHDGIVHPTAEGAGPVNENQPITVQDSADGDRPSESEKSDADLLETEQLLKETFENHDGIVHPTAEGAGPVNENQPITVQDSADGDRSSESEKSDADLLETEQLLKETFENHDGIVHPTAEGAGPVNENQPITVQESADGDRPSESEKSDADLLETEQLLKETFENHDGIVHPTAEGAGPTNEDQPITVQESADDNGSSESEKSDADLLETEQLLKETFENHDGIVHPTAEGAGPVNENQPITVQESADGDRPSESEKSDADLLETEQLLKETFENHDGIVHPPAEGAGPTNEDQPITVQESADDNGSSESEKSDADLLETEQLLKETFENHDGIVHPTAEGAGPVNENQPITVQDSADGDRSSESEKSDADLLETEQLLKETFENHDGIVHPTAEGAGPVNENQPITVQESADGDRPSESEKSDADLLETEQLLKETFENHDGIVHPTAEGAGSVNENQPITVQDSADGDRSSESEKGDADLLETEQLLKETFENHDGIVHPTAEGAGPVNENQPITVQDSADGDRSSESEKSDADLLETEQLLKETFENHDGIVHPTSEGAGPVNENQPITVQESADGDRPSESEKSDADLLETEQLLKETFENHDGIVHPTAEGAGPVNENQPITVQDSADDNGSSESEKSDADLLETEQLLKETFENHDGIVHPTSEGAGPVNENQPITVQGSADEGGPPEEANAVIDENRSIRSTRWGYCPGVVSGRNCYRVYRGPKKAEDAELFCQNNFFRGHLASISNKYTHFRVMYMIQRQIGYTRTWIGGLRYLQTGRFIWLDGERWSYASWLPGEPNDTVGVEDCVELLANGRFNDFTCRTPQAFLCSYPLY
ncbi:uncharacterized protein V6R79_020133 [Siganus canaliculatus]